MENNSDESQNEGFVAGIPVQSENIAFRADEMIVCAKCGKANPPNRASCLYCATPIVLPEERKLQAKLNLRPLENWEKGFNLVFIRSAGDADAAGAAGYLSIDPEILSQMVGAKHPLPIARIESEADAGIAVEQLKKFGLSTSVVCDETLKADKIPTRLRGIEFIDGSIAVTTFNTGDRIQIGREDLVLIVAGSVIESKTESVEKRRKKETKLLQETETTSDEKLIDIYSGNDMTGFRIPTNGFDFSCLGSDKGLLAAENMDRLRERLMEFSPAAKVIDEYRLIVNILGTIWDVDRQKDFPGLTRTSTGRSGFAKVERSSNLIQFTKYSRLQRHLI